MKLSRLARILFSIGVLAAGTTGCVKGMLGGSASTGTSSAFGGSSASGGSSAGESAPGPGGNAPATPDGSDPYPAPDKPGTIDPSAPKPVQALWQAFVAAHQGATVANARETGKKIWPLLGGDAQGSTSRIGRILRQLRWDKVGVDQETLTYRLIGEIAASRANRVVGADLEVKMRSRDDGSVTAEFTGHYRGDLIPDFEAREEDGAWTFVPSGGLFAGPREEWRSTEDDPKNPASVEALAAAWAKVLDHGTAAEAWKLLSSGSHNGLLSTANNDGFDKFAVLSVIGTALETRQAKKLTVTGQSVDGRKFTLTYSDGTTEELEATEFSDEWFVELP